MRAVVKHGRSPGDVAVLDVPEPVAAPGQVLVRTQACGLCGSDVHAWRQDPGYDWVRVPVVLGHEAVGSVVSAGEGVDESWIGRRVVPVSIDGCGQCTTCASGRRQLCPQRSVLGLSFDGAGAELFAVDASRLVAVPDGPPAALLALVEPLSVAARAVGRLPAPPAVGAGVVVSGPGPIGLMAALLLTGRGYPVVLTGAPRDLERRLPFAASLGLTTLVAGQDDLPWRPGAWVEASGAGAALVAACRSVVPGGVVVVPGLFPAAPAIDMNVVVRNEVTLQGSYGSLREDYEAAVAALTAEPLLWSRLTTSMPLSDATAALERTAAAEVVKVVVAP